MQNSLELNKEQYWVGILRTHAGQQMSLCFPYSFYDEVRFISVSHKYFAEEKKIAIHPIYHVGQNMFYK